jgi:hypothetical protein
VSMRVKDAWDGIIPTFLPFSPRDVAGVSVPSHHLLAPVRGMQTHRNRPVRLEAPGPAEAPEAPERRAMLE